MMTNNNLKKLPAEEWMYMIINRDKNTGYWVDDKCSICGKGIEDLIISPEWYQNEEPNFCPFCGAKMEAK